jgi:transposase
MSQDLQELKRERQRLREQRVIDAKALERARARTTGLLTDPSNRSFAATLTEDLEKLDKRIAAIEAEIEKTEGGGQKS